MTDISPFSGFGLGLRREHYDAFMDGAAKVDFVEVISENYMVDGGKPLAVLDAVRGHYPIALHGVSLSIGSAHGVDMDYLSRLRALAERVRPLWVSDHLCWTRTNAHNSHDLLPLPYTAEALQTVCNNLDAAQNALGRAILLENPSSYLEFPENEMSEAAFLAEVARRSGCYLLLDVNNVYVSAQNHGFDADAYIDALPLERVRQVHLAGHTPAQEEGGLLIDTHDRAVLDAVWALYRRTMAKLGDVAVMIERDDAIPPLPELLAELDIARALVTEEAA